MMEAYSRMLEQLKSGCVDIHFSEYANYVYQDAWTGTQEERKAKAVEIHEALYQGMQQSTGLIFPIYSYLLAIDANPVYMENFLKLIRGLQKDGQLMWQKAYYLFAQLNRLRLQHTACDTENVRELLSELMRRAVINCMRGLNVAVSPMPYQKRNAETIVVLTEEFSQADRDWMDFVLGCCYQLQHELGKRVLLVNTAESASRAGELSYFMPAYGEEDTSLRQQTEIEWQGERFEYLQCADVLSDSVEIEKFVEKILAYCPGMALHFGDSSFLAGILDQWTPVLAMGKTYGALAVSGAEFQVSYDSRQEAHEQLLNVVRDHQQFIQDEGNLRVRLVFPADYFREEERTLDYYELGPSNEYVMKHSFHIEKMMKRAWAVSIRILKEIERICRKHQISYFADWGTLLGAIRHKGFVPWDDDIDIAMKREDYNRFYALAKKELPEGYCIVDPAHDEGWPNTRARVLNVPNADSAQMQLKKEELEELYGCPFVVGIDIQALDYIPRNEEDAELQGNILQNVMSVAYTLQHNGVQVTEDVRKQLDLIEVYCNYRFTEDKSMLHQVLKLGSAIAQMYGKEDGDEITFMYSSAFMHYRGYRLKPEWYAESIAMPFETTTVQVPKGYLKILETAYGEGWNVCYSGGAAHDYPFYKSQLERLQKMGIVLD